jgi:integrase
MASVWKHPKCPYWTACFTDKTGRRRKQTTKETNQRKALKLAEAYELAAKKRRTFTQVREVLQNLHKEITGEELKEVSVRTHIENWLAEKMDETKPATMHFYGSSTTKFLTFLGERADEDISAISRNDVIAYRKTLAASLSSTSTNQNIKCLRMVFKSARRESLVSENPAEFVDTVKKKGGYERRPFTIPELQAVMRVADPEWKSMILFGIYTGQRLSDIAGLTWTNIDMKNQEIRLETAKTGKLMKIPLAPPLLRHLESLKFKGKPETPVHPRASTTLNKTYKTSTLSNQFANILALAGLRKKVSHVKEQDGRTGAKKAAPLSFHGLRHTAVTMLKEAGIPAAVVMELIGHDSEQMSEHYTHVGSEALKKAAESLPDVTNV